MFLTSQFKIQGVSPLIPHNGQLADPLNSYTKEIKKITSKRDKTDADYEQLGKIEWFGSMYWGTCGPCLPGEMFESLLTQSAKKKRKGQQAKAGIYCDGNFPIVYDGPKTPEELWENEAFRLRSIAVRNRSRVVITRPYFQNWGLEFTVTYSDELLNPAEIHSFLQYAGMNVGLGDWRPKFGRFELQE